MNTIIFLSIITGFGAGFLVKSLLQRKVKSDDIFAFVMVDILHVEAKRVLFTVEAFQALVPKIGLPAAILAFEDHFKVGNNFADFTFSKPQLREIACATCIAKDSTKVFPAYLRRKAINLLAKGLLTIDDAIEEYIILDKCHSIDNDGTLEKMVQRYLKTPLDCDKVMERINSVSAIYTTAKEIKKNFVSKETIKKVPSS